VGAVPGPPPRHQAAAREIGLSLEEALQLVLLYATYEPEKLEQAALRWFRRYLDESPKVTLLEAQIALAAPGELRSCSQLAQDVLFKLASGRLDSRTTAA
jgi:hypothetical protein